MCRHAQLMCLGYVSCTHGGARIGEFQQQLVAGTLDDASVEKLDELVARGSQWSGGGSGVLSCCIIQGEHGARGRARPVCLGAHQLTYGGSQRRFRGSCDGLGSSRDLDRKSTRLNSSHLGISYAVFCLKKKKKKNRQ